MDSDAANIVADGGEDLDYGRECSMFPYADGDIYPPHFLSHTFALLKIIRSVWRPCVAGYGNINDLLSRWQMSLNVIS